MKNYRFFLGLLTSVLVISLLLADFVMAEQPILVYLNGQLIKADVEPHIVNGRIYLPVRAFCEALGAKVNWDADNSVVNIELNNNTTPETEEDSDASLIQSKKAPNLVGAYAMIIDELYRIDPGLNHDIKYIAIDTSGMANLTAQEKIELLKIIDDKYDLVILNKTEEELAREGYIKNIEPKGDRHYENIEEGILISISDKPIEKNTITLFANKYRSALGAMGYSELILEYKDGNWVIKSYGSMIAS